MKLKMTLPLKKKNQWSTLDLDNIECKIKLKIEIINNICESVSLNLVMPED